MKALIPHHLLTLPISTNLPLLIWHTITSQILAFDTILPPHSFIIKSKFLPLFFFSTITILILYVYQKYL